MSITSQKKNMKEIYHFISQQFTDYYNITKKQFHTKSAAFLKALANDLKFKEFKVTKNYGGVAVSGEITLMGMWSENNGLYLQLSQFIPNKHALLYRQIFHMKDYTGGINQWIPCNLFADGDYEKLVAVLSKSNKSKEVINNVF